MHASLKKNSQADTRFCLLSELGSRDELSAEGVTFSRILKVFVENSVLTTHFHFITIT